MADQIRGLTDRGMAVPDVAFAARCLTHIGYRRLSAYGMPLQSSREPTARFRPGTSFDQVIMLYMFDQRLRSLLLEALSYVEISVRNQWSHHVVQSSSKGEFAHLDAILFDTRYYSSNVQELERNYNQVHKRSSLAFQSASIWDIATTMPFGSLSKWYSSLTDPKVRQSISSNYGMDEMVFVNAIKHLTSVRNMCAHHERIWNRAIETGLTIPRRLSGSRDNVTAFNKSNRDRRRIYNTLVIIIHLLETITPNGGWSERLLALLAEYRYVPYHSMGFPPGWREFTIWQKHPRDRTTSS